MRAIQIGIRVNHLRLDPDAKFHAESFNVLNLNIPQAFDYLVERMSWLLGEHAVDYVKWDMNIEHQLVSSGRLGIARQRQHPVRMRAIQIGIRVNLAVG
jgi:alpha-galactosidase